MLMIRVNSQEQGVSDISDLRARLSAVHDSPWAEVDLHNETDSGATGTFFDLTGLFNRDAGRALLLYARFLDDRGFASRDRAYSGPKKAMLEFELSNGQVDAYPAYWTIPAETALRAIEYAFVHRAPDPSVVWNDETIIDSWEEWSNIIADDHDSR